MSTPHRPRLFLLLIGLLSLELLLIAGLTVVLIVELFIDEPESIQTAIALAVLAAIATAWLTAIVVGAIRGQAWIRGAAIVWQVLQFAVGFGAVQGAFVGVGIGLGLAADRRRDRNLHAALRADRGRGYCGSNSRRVAPS